MDAFFYWLFADQTGVLGCSKSFVKDDLRYMPVLGWLFYFGEFVFLKRKWEEDKQNLASSIDLLMNYNFPVMLFLLAEGTRYTPEKHTNSLKWAAKHGEPIDLKYHLVPRVKGFNYSLRHLQQECKFVC